jgi:hypothetical protein
VSGEALEDIAMDKTLKAHKTEAETHQTKKLLHSKGINEQSEEKTYRAGGNICKLNL